MFSKTIFKQTLNQNWKLWTVFTALTTAMSAVFISVFDPKMMQGMVDTLSDIPGIGDMISGILGGGLLEMLGNSFYSLQGIILPLVFCIMTANSLVASQVDRGSMAYTLSTPIKRVKVVSTQAIYMITSVFCMFLVVTIVGLGVVQIRHNGLWGEAYTPDVTAASETLNRSREDISGDLNLILNNQDAIKAGANARGIEEDVYITYLNLKIAENLELNEHETAPDAEQAREMQNKLVDGFSAAADELGIEVSDLMTSMRRMKENQNAINAAVSASGLPEIVFIGVINQQLADRELKLDHGIDFKIADYVNLNLGIFLLMFAIAGISFMFSCIFNLTKNSLTFGAGIPIAFLIFEIMSQASGELENLKYLSLNTLFNPSAITGGGTFAPQFIILAVLGAALYLVGIKVFKEKDLPL